MPAIIDPSVCDHQFATCFPARMCPEKAFSVDAASGHVVIDSSLCGTCPGPCTNFCDRYAIRYAKDPDEFEVLAQKTLGDLSEAEAAAELARRKEERAAAEAAEAKAAATDGSVLNATSATFDELVLQSPLPVVVDFWAPWCGPCQMMAPVFDKLASQYQEHVSFVKVNVDEEQQLAMRYQVQAIPTLAFFWRGQLVNRHSGALPEAPLQAAVYQFLSVVRAREAAEASANEADQNEVS